eukprot:5937687-Prymnesium_polylepis.1
MEVIDLCTPPSSPVNESTTADKENKALADVKPSGKRKAGPLPATFISLDSDDDEEEAAVKVARGASSAVANGSGSGEGGRSSGDVEERPAPARP